MDAERRDELRKLDRTAQYSEMQEALCAIDELEAKLSLSCEALGPFAEAGQECSHWPAHKAYTIIPKAGLLHAARDAVAQCRPDANPVADLTALLRKCRDRFAMTTLANFRSVCDSGIEMLDAALGEEVKR